MIENNDDCISDRHWFGLILTDFDRFLHLLISMIRSPWTNVMMNVSYYIMKQVSPEWKYSICDLYYLSSSACTFHSLFILPILKMGIAAPDKLVFVFFLESEFIPDLHFNHLSFYLDSNYLSFQSVITSSLYSKWRSPRAESKNWNPSLFSLSRRVFFALSLFF